MTYLHNFLVNFATRSRFRKIYTENLTVARKRNGKKGEEHLKHSKLSYFIAGEKIRHAS